MSGSIRLASFNVENLFSRAAVLNGADQVANDRLLKAIDELQGLVFKSAYSKDDKTAIVRKYRELTRYIEITEDLGKLFKRRGEAIASVSATGYKVDWDGAIRYKPAKFSELTRKNTARAIRDTGADVFCIVEIEGRLVLSAFDSQMLGSRYAYNLSIEGRDPRGIDLGLYSKHPFGRVFTHIFDRDGNNYVFSRDCLEVEVLLPGGQILHVLCNHFKSRGHDPQGTSAQKREGQAKRVAEILRRYDLTRDLVVVCGDFNDNPASPALQPLLTVPYLFDVLALQFPAEPGRRWTYFYDRCEQIDFLLVSRPLKDRFRQAGVERRGIFELKKKTEGAHGAVDIEQTYPGVTSVANAASDHGAIWADFDL